LRFAIRNQHKIEEVYSKDFFDLLKNSLKLYFKGRSTYIAKEYKDHKVIEVESINKKETYIFVVLSQKYDVVHVAYYKSIK